MNLTQLSPKAAVLCEIMRMMPFKVTQGQGHRFWNRWKARMRLADLSNATSVLPCTQLLRRIDLKYRLITTDCEI